MAVRDAGQVDAAVCHEGGERRAQAWPHAQTGFEPQAEDGTGLRAALSDVPAGIHGGDSAPGPGGRIEHRLGTALSFPLGCGHMIIHSCSSFAAALGILAALTASAAEVPVDKLLNDAQAAALNN